MCENKIKYHLFIMPLIWILILNAILFGDPGETCNEAVDYGLINGDTIISGNFDSEGEDYWIKFSTSCVFRDVTISSCGSFVSEDEWLDTFLEVYSDLDSGSSACEEFEPYNILIGEEPNTPWWNDDPPQNLQCNFNNENLPEQYHAVLVIPTAQEQAINVQIQPGTYYLRVSTYPGNNQVGDWQVSISGRATVAPNVEDQYLELPHNPSDGSPGGSMTVELDASESLCIEQIAIYEWFEDDISIAGPTSDINQYVSLDYGDHNLHLNITDLVGTNYQESFMVSISEPNSNPVSDAGESQFITVPHDGSPATNVITVTLLGDSSNDLDGDDLTFNWEKITGPDDMALSDTQAENPTFNTFNTFGSSSKEYEFKLTVADPYQTLDIDTTSVTIYAEENIIPIASASDLQINILHDGDPSTFNSEEFTLNGSASYDLDGDNITSYMWFDSELDTLSEIAYYTGALNYSTIDSVLGDHTFTLVVVDSYDEVGNTSITLTVGPELNSAPIVLFDPPIAEFMMNPDDNPGGFQMVVLDVYNASFDPDNYDSEGNELPDELKTDEIVSEWFDADGNPALPLQNLSAGQSSFTLRVTDSYGASSESIFNVLISEPNAVPSAITNGYEEFYESTVDLNEDGLPDTLYLYGQAVDTDHTENNLGSLWRLLEENSGVSILNDSSLTGSFLSDEVLHNDYPIQLDFSLIVWDPFSCYMYNTQSFEDSNNNGQWDEDEAWDSFCINGQDSTTYDEAFLNIDIINYNQSPQIFPGSYIIDPIVINEDEDTEVFFDYNLWTENNFFFDTDDCQFNSETNECMGYYRYKCSQGNDDPNDDIYSNILDDCENLCLVEDGCREEFSVNIINGDNFSGNNAILIPNSDYFGMLMVPLQINDNNDINNLSDTIIVEVEVLPVNDFPVILSFNNDEFLNEGVSEDSQFTINLEDLSYYDVEGDEDNDGVCNEGECSNIELSLESSVNYSFVGEDIVILTQDFFGDLEIGLQIFDGEDISDPLYISIPVEGVNDYPHLISNMDTIYFSEDFDDLSYDLGNIFSDVDGDNLFYEKIDQDGPLIFNSEIVDNELLMLSIDNLYGFQEMYFEVSDGVVSIDQTIVFSIEPIDDSPIVISNTLSTEEYSLGYIPLEVQLEAIDIDSDEVFFEIVSYPVNGTLGSEINVDLSNPFLATIDYTPEDGYRCADSLTYRANDYNSYSEVTGTITINVGNCNQAPDLIINLTSSINIPEDSPIHFIESYEDLGWCLDSEGAWSQLDESDCSDGTWQWETPDYYIPLNNVDYFEVTDEDIGDSNFIEIWEHDYYYIENGYCASSNSDNDWNINTEAPCGLIAPNETCTSAQAIETGYEDGYKYCPCNAGETCTASQKFIDNNDMNGSLSVRPIKDYDLPFEILMIANDDNLTYNISTEEYIPIVINPINDSPIISSIEDQEINEGEVLELSYSSYEPDFTIYDVDSDILELTQESSPSTIFMITEDNSAYNCPDSTLCLQAIDPDWNGYAQIYITLNDNDVSNPGYAISQFTLAISQVDDEPEFTGLSIEGGNGSLLTLIEDTNPITYDNSGNPIVFAREVKIFYTDNDWDSNLNENPEEQFIPNEISLMIEPANANPEIVFSPYLDPTPIQDPITNELYYSQVIILDTMNPDWNGMDGVNFTINGNRTFLLEVMATPQNDAPYDINQISSNIESYNQNLYDWEDPGTGTEISICELSEAQGTYNYSSQECEISNFYLDSNDIKYYRLPYKRYPSDELIDADLITFKWMLTDDIDREYQDIDIFYRLELVDSLLNRAIVLEDFIPHSNFEDLGQSVGSVDIDLNQLFFSYNLDLDYFDYCEFNDELTLSDISDVYLDLRGDTKYTWRVSANNGIDCDELNLDPSSTFLSCSEMTGEQSCNIMHYCEWIENPVNNENSACLNYINEDECISSDTNGDGLSDCIFIDGECLEFEGNCYKNTGNDFYIDITPPIASISILQNTLAPDLMELYFSFDESVNTSKSQVFIGNNSSSVGYNFDSHSDNNIYSMVRPFPDTGIITLNIESWDEVGNGIITSRAVTYEYISSSTYSNISSPDGSFLMEFDEGDIESDASLLIQKVESEGIEFRSDIEIVSDLYSISSVNMDIINDINIEFLIPENLQDIDHWKFRIIQNDNDITSFSKDGVIYAKLIELGDIALYYDPLTDFSVPEDIDLVGNYPNPFNPSTSIYYIVDTNDSFTRIVILDLLGREVRVLYEGLSSIGYYEIIWDGTSDSGHQLGSGIYFINAKIGSEQLYKKVMKLK